MSRVSALGGTRFAFGEEERWREMASPWEEKRFLPPLYPLYLPTPDEDPSLLSPMTGPRLSHSSLPSPSSPAGKLLHSFDYTQILKGTPPSSPSLSSPSLSSPSLFSPSRSFNSRSNPSFPPPQDPSLESPSSPHSPHSPSPHSTSPLSPHSLSSLSPHSLSSLSLSSLSKFLPRNNSDEALWDPSDVYSCNEFRMFEFKIRRCMRGRSHDWTECPFAHPGEKARRRDPRRVHYGGTACPDFRKGACRRGDTCEFAHGVFECWLHPARYRTQPCKDGGGCKRRVCFFAHTKEQLRLLPGAAKAQSLGLPLSLSLPPSNGSGGSPLSPGSGSAGVSLPLSVSMGSPLGMSLSLHLPKSQSVLSPTSTLSPPLTPDLSPSRSPPRNSYSPSTSSYSCSPEEQLLAHWNGNAEDISIHTNCGGNSKGVAVGQMTMGQMMTSSPPSSSSPRGVNPGNPYERFHQNNVSPQEMAFLESQLGNSHSSRSSPGAGGGGTRGRFGMVSQAEKMSELLASLQALEMGSSSSSPPLPPPSLSSPRVWAQKMDQNLCGDDDQSRLRTAVSLPASLRWMEEAMREETMAVGVERVESGRDLRAKIYGSLEGEVVDSPDFSWVGDLVESSSNGNGSMNGNGGGNVTNGNESGNSVVWNGGWNRTACQESNAAWC